MDLSVIVPIYNTEPWLTECLDSAAAAVKGLDAEVILVDDGSTDNSGKIAKEYSENNPQFIYIHKENSGLSSTRNYAISLSRGKYLAFLDSDDIVACWLYKDMLELAEKNRTPLTICNATRIDDSGKATVWPIGKKAFMGRPESVSSIRRNLNLVYDTSVINKLVLKEFWNKHGLSFADGFTFEDLPVSIRMHWYAENVSVIHRFGYYYRIRKKGEKSITQQTHSISSLEDRIHQENDLLSFIKEHLSEPGAKEILFTVQKRLACSSFEKRINDLYLAKKSTREQIVNLIGDFFRKEIPEDVLDVIPSYHAQKARCIMSGDIDRLIRLVNHKSMAWNTAPVKEISGGYKMILPEDIYNISMTDASKEYQFSIPQTSITDISLEGSSLTLEITLYHPRIDLPDPGSQKVSAFFYNDMTGKFVDIATSPIPSPNLTKKKGMKICLDDYRVYNYDYDNAGYRLTADLSQLRDKGKGPWLICLDYETPISKGNRILRGIGPAAKKYIDKELGKIQLNENDEAGQDIFRAAYDLRQTFYIESLSD